MNAKRLVWTACLVFLCASVASSVVLADSAQAHASVSQPTPRLLLLDCTKTFASTMRVGGLAAFLRASGAVDVTVQFGDAAGMYDIPVVQEDVSSAEPFDVIVIIPRGIDDGSAGYIWIVSNILPNSSPDEWAQIVVLRTVLGEAFTGLAQAADPTVDLWAGFTASLYTAQGWLR